MRTYAELTTSYIVFVNRVGVDETVTFWGGSQVIDPSGDVAFEAPLLEPGLFTTEIDLDNVRRERVSMPLLRDERPEYVLRQLERLVRERAGIESRED
jgi:predicted amidohydrolase